MLSGLNGLNDLNGLRSSVNPSDQKNQDAVDSAFDSVVVVVHCFELSNVAALANYYFDLMNMKRILHAVPYCCLLLNWGGPVSSSAPLMSAWNGWISGIETAVTDDVVPLDFAVSRTYNRGQSSLQCHFLTVHWTNKNCRSSVTYFVALLLQGWM